MHSIANGSSPALHRSHVRNCSLGRRLSFKMARLQISIIQLKRKECTAAALLRGSMALHKTQTIALMRARENEIDGAVRSVFDFLRPQHL